MNYKDPKPDIQRIEELVTSVKNGDIKLPKFQRPFVWKRKEVLKLLDSIYKGYPIGSILLWYSSESLASERTIADLELNSEKEIYPTNYLLDGQQRLSSLCGALYWNGRKLDSLWNIAFDLEKEEFIYPKDGLRIEYFPLNKLLNTSDFLTQCKSFEAHPSKDKFFKNAEKLLRSIKDYKIAVVKIGDMSIKEVSPIFERINSTGRKLTIVDLMRAATWKGGFDLNDAINKVKNICTDLRYLDIPDNHILRNISACAGLGINREDIDRLRNKTSQELEIASEKCSIAYNKAITFIKEELPLPSYAYLPYGLQLTFLVEFFNLSGQLEQVKDIELIKWFWSTAFTRHFGYSNTGQNSRDLEKIRAFASNQLNSITVDRDILLDRLVYDEFRLNIANSKTFVMLLASKSPRSLISGEPIDIHKSLKEVNRFEFSHIIPPSLFPEKNLNICLNIILLNQEDSLLFSNKRPSLFFDKFINSKDNDSLTQILESNFIDDKCLEALVRDDIEGFFNARKELIRKDVEKLSGKKTIPGNVKEFESDDEDENNDY